MRIGVSARLAKTALAEWSGVPLDEIEAVWHGLEPPYAPLFAWLEGKGPRPDTAGRPTFTPLMLAQALEDDDLRAARSGRIIAPSGNGTASASSSSRAAGGGSIRARGDDIGPAFPEIVAALPEGVVLDGELLVMRDGEVAPFNDLQQRLNRKTRGAEAAARFSRLGAALRPARGER